MKLVVANAKFTALINVTVILPGLDSTRLQIMVNSYLSQCVIHELK